MTYVYLICFLLSVIAVICLLGLTPERITTDLMKFVSPKQTLRDKVLAQKGRKKSRKLTVELNRIRDALITTGKGGQFTIACASSLLLMLIGCIVAIAIGNAFLIPVLAIAFALIPFAYAKRTISYYNNHIQQDLENALSLTTTAYLRTDDIITAVCSYIPFTSPMAMFTRICMSTVAWYEIFISIAILIGSTVGIGVLSAKIYRVGVLLYGTPPRFTKIIKEVLKK